MIQSALSLPASLPSMPSMPPSWPNSYPDSQPSNGHCCSPSGAHYWLIPTPSGPISTGTCRYCNNTRQFRNYIESDWKSLLEGWYFGEGLEGLA